MFYELYFLSQLFEQNADAILNLPFEVKTIMMISLAIFFGSALLRRAWRLVKIALIVTVIYFGCAYLGII